MPTTMLPTVQGTEPDAAPSTSRSTLGDEVRVVPLSLRPWRPESPAQAWAWTAMVTAVAALTRFWALGFPHGKSFDELYYATEAQEMLRYGYESNPGYMFIVHPPLGKWAIALTSWMFGDNSFGWRAAPAIAGTLSVLILTRLAMRMFRSVFLGAVAGLLLSLDGISLVMSRVALLDIFLQTFILAGFAALVLDRDQLRGRLGGLYAAGVDLRFSVPSFGPRPWRLLAGIMFGCAFAVKWSALSYWAGFSLLSLLWDIGALRAAGVLHPFRVSARRSWLGGAFSLGVAAIGTYLLCWLGWFVGENSWNRHWADTHPGTGLFGLLPAPIRSLLDYHHQAYLFHSHLYSPHAYKANPWSWLVLGRPISFYYPSDPTGCGQTKCAREILLIGTPIMYWAFVPALVWLLWHWATTRDWRAGSVLLAFIVGWGVWLQNQRRTGFLFYMTPLMPYLVLGLTLAIGTMLARSASDADPDARGVIEDDVAGLPFRSRLASTLAQVPVSRLARTGVVAIWAGAVVADFIWMWPLYTGGLLTYGEWLQRMWFPSWI